MSKIYKINLYPVGWYFFGGETTFGENQSSNYYAKSNFLPQETAILGMLRFELLKAKKLIPIRADNKSDVEELIGSESFNYMNRTDASKHFGAIKSISSVYIQRGDNDILYKMPANCNKEVSLNQGAETKVCFTLHNDNAKLPFVDGFKGKDYYSGKWVSLLHKDEIPEIDRGKPKDAIFRTMTKIGITKLEKERIERDETKDGFFKTELCTLNPEYSFVFYAELDTNDIDGDRLVNLGAERSVFHMRVQKLNDGEQSFPNQLKNNLPMPEGQLLFISDAFVDSNVLSNCSFAWVDTVPFRNLTRKNKANHNYASLGNGEKSGRYNLIKRGSILYFEDNKLDDILQLIDNDYLQAYGYNQYVINQKK